MPQQKPRRAAAGEPRRLHPGSLPSGQGLAAGQPGIFGPGHGGQRQNGVVQPAPQGPGHRQGEHQPRKGQEYIGYAHEHRIRPSAEKAAAKAHGGAEHGDRRHQQQRGENAGAAPHNDPGQHIPAITVRPQQMLRRGRGLGLAQVLQIGVIGGQIRGKRRKQNQQQGQDPENHQPGSDAAPDGWLSHSRLTPSRIRGSSAWYKRSVTRFTAT